MKTTTTQRRGRAIDPASDNWSTLLANMQGNILKFHGRDNAYHLFLNFNPKNDRDIAALRNWISALNITSAAEQLKDSKTFKDLLKIKPKNRTTEQNTQFEELATKIASFFFLTQSGYNALGVSTPWLTDPSFQHGMKKRTALQDPSPDTWDFSPSDDGQQRIDALIIIASDNFRYLVDHQDHLLESLPPAVSLVHVQYGEPLRQNHLGIEHFGYADGISQPIMLTSDLNNGGKLWNDEMSPFDVALVKDEGVQGVQDAYGSYFVFRKLDQNVKAFKEAEEGLGLDEIGGAYVVGRFEDGTPVAKHAIEQHPAGESELDNDFNYKNDLAANKCPFHAHIRMTNPRDKQDPSQPIRIVRRGITYDEAGRGGNLNWHPEGKVGLLFMCYQKSIRDQFEKLQIEWANDGKIFDGKVAVDGIIGQGRNNNNPQQFPHQWNSKVKLINCSVSHFVTMKGGEYFFAPALPFINNAGSMV